MAEEEAHDTILIDLHRDMRRFIGYRTVKANAKGVKTNTFRRRRHPHHFALPVSPGLDISLSPVRFAP